jgi:hypothetical protein
MSRSNSGIGLEDRGKALPGQGLWIWTVVTAILGAVLSGGAVFYVWLYVQQVNSGYRLSKLYGEYEQLVVVDRKLRLEWARFQDPFQLEEMGRNHFKLGPPRKEQKIQMH